VSVIGTLLEDDGLKVRTGFSFEVKQAKSESKTTGTLDVKHADLGGAKAALAATYEQNEKSEIKIKPKLNLEVSDEFNLGVSAVYDMATFKDIWGQIVYKPADMKN